MIAGPVVVAYREKISCKLELLRSALLEAVRKAKGRTEAQNGTAAFWHCLSCYNSRPVTNPDARAS
jgi:hypothetical protein